MTSQDELIQRLGSLLISDPEVAAQGWQQLVLVGIVDATQSRMNGFCYMADGESEPAAPRNVETLRVLAQLQREMGGRADQPPWVSCLIRIDRASNKMHVDFEYEHAERWMITRANARQRALELRPPAAE